MVFGIIAILQRVPHLLLSCRRKVGLWVEVATSTPSLTLPLQGGGNINYFEVVRHAE